MQVENRSSIKILILHSFPTLSGHLTVSETSWKNGCSVNVVQCSNIACSVWQPPPSPFTLAPYTNYRPFRPFLFNLAELLKGRITLFTRYITIQWTSSVDVVAAPVAVVVFAVFFFPYRFPQIFSAFLSYHKCNVTSLTDLISVYVTVLTYLKFVDHSTNQKIQRCKKHQYSKTKINRPPHRAM